MPEFIKKEFSAHPVGTSAVLLTCISFMAGGLTWIKAQGAEANDLQRDVSAIAESVETVAGRVERHIENTSYKKQVEQFPTRREYSNTVIEIKNGQKRLESEMQEQRKLSVEILTRLSK